MHGNSKTPLPFQVPPNTPLVGQPITLLSAYVPATVTFLCNCEADAERQPLTIHDGVAVQCPRCRTTYNAFQPAEKLQVKIDKPAVEVVPS